MSALVPYNSRNRYPIDSFYSLLDDFFTDSFSARRSLDSFKVDVAEDESKYTIEADMPGVKKEDIRLDINEGRMTIAVQQNEEKESKNDNYIHRERRSSSVARSIYLSEAANDGIEAKLEDGVLKINVPKAPKTDSRRRIDIN